MPLIIISGFPKSGKSTRAHELKEYFESRSKTVKIISENVAVPNADYEKNEFFVDSQKEKLIRSYLKSEVTRHLNQNDTIILDAGNYIKGYRYELYCVSKSVRTTQCTVFCAIPIDRAWEFNTNTNSNDLNADEETSVKDNSQQSYRKDIFDALVLRYEEPCGNNRWDSPLFTVFPDSPLKLDDIYSALYESKPPPPNQSTQNAPLSATNYLFELDKKTQDITSTIVSARKIGQLGPVRISKDLIASVPDDMNASQLNRLRRQFLNYNKLHQGGGMKLESIPQLFVQFLNSNYNK